jgi:hypothetical protein
VTAATDLAVGSGFVCILQEGSLLCWGAEWGTDGLTDDCRMQTANSGGGGGAAQWEYCPHPRQLTEYTDFIDVDAEGRHACAIRATGALWCWGEWQASTPQGTFEMPPTIPRAAARAIYQAVLDLPALEPFWHPEVDGRSPLRILANAHFPIVELRMFNRAVQRITDGVYPYFEFTSLTYTGDRAEIEFGYPSEGVRGRATLERNETGWAITSSDVAER